jgi:hypothetical protein
LRFGELSSWVQMRLQHLLEERCYFQDEPPNYDRVKQDDYTHLIVGEPSN